MKLKNLKKFLEIIEERNVRNIKVVSQNKETITISYERERCWIVNNKWYWEKEERTLTKKELEIWI